MRITRKAAALTAVAGLGLALSAPAAAQAAPVSAPAAVCHPQGGIDVDGNSRTVTVTTPGDGACFTFNGHAGQVLNLGIYSTDSQNGWWPFGSRVAVRDPQGTVVASYNGGSAQAPAITRLQIPALATSGTYAIEVKPVQTDNLLGTFLYLSTRTFLGNVAIDGPGKPVTLDRVGQDKDIRFWGAASKLVQVNITDYAIKTRHPNGFHGMWIEVLRPNGAVAYKGIASGNGAHAVGPLRIDGESTIRVYPADGSLGSATVGVSTLPE
jgi:hypothetical protein